MHPTSISILSPHLSPPQCTWTPSRFASSLPLLQSLLPPSTSDIHFMSPSEWFFIPFFLDYDKFIFLLLHSLVFFSTFHLPPFPFFASIVSHCLHRRVPLVPSSFHPLIFFPSFTSPPFHFLIWPLFTNLLSLFSIPSSPLFLACLPSTPPSLLYLTWGRACRYKTYTTHLETQTLSSLF